ncbi:MAG: hypothetical protein WD845_06860 [Pirellulales bacterium]
MPARRNRSTKLLMAGVLACLAPSAIRAVAAVPFDDLVLTRTETAARPRSLAPTLAQQVVAASGRSPETAAEVERELNARIDQLQRRGTVVGNALDRARVIHEFIHADILRGKYDPAASDLAVTLAGGAYNCASVSAVFLTFAQAFGVDATAVSVVGHVWCRIETEAGPFDVETTCRDWFVLAAARAGFTPQEHARQSPAWQEHLRRVAQARELDQAAFLAVFHYNRGVRLLRQGEFEAAAAANRTALELDWRCEPAYGNLWAALGGRTGAKQAEREVSAGTPTLTSGNAR